MRGIDVISFHGVNGWNAYIKERRELMLVLVLLVVFNTSKLTCKKLTPWMFGWRC
jgi:hypothetical protein